jgi:alginate O-acetyltransferase complex protein AlgI
MGFKLMDNFNRPYFSKSISEFWKRWHISLSTWFKDYLYISLGGNKVSKSRREFNLFFTFLVSGLWHGANWTYIIWGALNGFYLIFSLWTNDFRTQIAKSTGIIKFPKFHKYFKVFITFCLISFAWIFFRAKNVGDAFYIVTHLFVGWDKALTLEGLKESINIGLNKKEFLLAILSIFFLQFIHLIQRHGSIRHMLSGKPLWYRWSIYYALVLGILFFGVFIDNQFIYFQF